MNGRDKEGHQAREDKLEEVEVEVVRVLVDLRLDQRVGQNAVEGQECQADHAEDVRREVGDGLLLKGCQELSLDASGPRVVVDGRSKLGLEGDDAQLEDEVQSDAADLENCRNLQRVSRERPGIEVRADVEVNRLPDGKAVDNEVHGDAHSGNPAVGEHAPEVVVDSSRVLETEDEDEPDDDDGVDDADADDGDFCDGDDDGVNDCGYFGC